jgi:hypothetical protein
VVQHHNCQHRCLPPAMRASLLLLVLALRLLLLLTLQLVLLHVQLVHLTPLCWSCVTHAVRAM